MPMMTAFVGGIGIGLTLMGTTCDDPVLTPIGWFCGMEGTTMFCMIWLNSEGRFEFS